MEFIVHQHEARDGAARRQARLTWIDGEIAPLYSGQGRPGIETRFVIGLLLLEGHRHGGRNPVHQQAIKR
jgi:hypothetical protein